VRALFSDFADDSLHNPSKHTPFILCKLAGPECCPQLSEMARTERSLMNRINTERFFNSYDGVRTFDGDKGKPNNLNISSFPVP